MGEDAAPQEVGFPPPWGTCLLTVEMASELLGETAEDDGFAYPKCVFSPASVDGYGLDEYVSIGEQAFPEQSIDDWRSKRRGSGSECSSTVERPDLGSGAYEEYCPVGDALGGGYVGRLNIPNGQGRWELTAELHRARAHDEKPAVELLHRTLKRLQESGSQAAETPSGETSPDEGSAGDFSCPSAAALSHVAGTELTEVPYSPSEGSLLGCQLQATSGLQITFEVTSDESGMGYIDSIIDGSGDTAPQDTDTVYIAWERGDDWILIVQQPSELFVNSGAYATADSFACFAMGMGMAEQADALEALSREASRITRSWCDA